MVEKKKTSKKKKSTEIKEGKTKKGGVNEAPTSARPAGDPPGQQVPAREAAQAVTATKGAPPQHQSQLPPPLPKFPPEEKEYLKYAYSFTQNLKHRAGFGLEGTVVRFHDIELLAKIAAIAVQRTEMLEKVIEKLEKAENELRTYREKHGDL